MSETRKHFRSRVPRNRIKDSKPLFDKYDRPTIHYFIKQREEAAKEMAQAAIEDAKYEVEQNRVKLDFDGMPLNYEEREYEKMLDYKSFLAGDNE